MLTATEKIEDFKEVTDAEKSAIEAADAKYERPAQLFIDQWNNAGGEYGRYNESTGYFELNGLTDITYKEALSIMSAHRNVIDSSYASLFSGDTYKARTLLPFRSYVYADAASIYKMFYMNYYIEVVRFLGERKINNMQYAFCGAKNIRHVYGVLECSAIQNFYALTDASNSHLETIYLKKVAKPLSFEHSPLLSLESLKYLITNAANTSAITITVHPEVYAKLTDEENTEWNQLISLASEKNITFTTI